MWVQMLAGGQMCPGDFEVLMIPINVKGKTDGTYHAGLS